MGADLTGCSLVKGRFVYDFIPPYAENFRHLKTSELSWKTGNATVFKTLLLEVWQK